MKITLSPEVIDWIIDVTCKDRSYGARPLRRAIQRYVEDPLSEELIRGHLHDGEIEVYLEAGQLAYRPAGAVWPEAARSSGLQGLTSGGAPQRRAAGRFLATIV
jgi:ATP-dependent Clp protease ATP-binding subunit ClpC